MQITSPVLRSLTLFAAICLCPVPVVAQVLQQFPIESSQSQPAGQADLPTTTERLTGTVVSSLDGSPVPRALVTSADQRFACFTDSQGRFSFDLHRTASAAGGNTFSSFPPDPTPAPSSGAIYFTVRKPGYVNATDTISLDGLPLDSPEPSLTLKIVPTGVIGGHVYAESGELPESLNLQLLRKQVNNGSTNWLPANIATADSRGEFRFANLDPGEYKLFISARVSLRDSGTGPSESAPGFLPTYYPNAAKADSAAILPVAPGSSDAVDLTLHAAPFYNVTIPVAGLPDQAGIQAILLDGLPGLRLEQKGQSIEGYLPAGVYDLLLDSAQPASNTNQNPPLSVASVHLEVRDKPVHTQPIALHPAPAVPVIVRRELTSGQAQPPNPPNQPSFFLFLQNVRQDLSQPPPSLKATTGDEGLSVVNVTPGEFHVTAWAGNGGSAYIAALTSGSTDLLREPLKVIANSDPRPIEITLRDDFASIDVNLIADPGAATVSRGQPTTVLCIPLDRPLAMPGVAAAQQNRATVKGLSPGRYLVLAAQGQAFQSIEYNNEDVLRGLMEKGTVVTVAPNENATVQVHLLADGGN
jgi:sarcosine oxidase gamma subunit